MTLNLCGRGSPSLKSRCINATLTRQFRCQLWVFRSGVAALKSPQMFGTFM
jgi:hypothetical protein